MTGRPGAHEETAIAVSRAKVTVRLASTAPGFSDLIVPGINDCNLTGSPEV